MGIITTTGRGDKEDEEEQQQARAVNRNWGFTVHKNKQIHETSRHGHTGWMDGWIT